MNYTKFLMSQRILSDLSHLSGKTAIIIASRSAND